MTDDPKCAACGEPRSAHVVTTQGPFTCRRVAQGEGLYEYTGTWSAGLNCSSCHGGICDGHEMYRFATVDELKRRGIAIPAIEELKIHG